MTVRAVLAPLVRGATYRRGVYLLLGGVLLLPYVLLGVVFARMLTGPAAQRGAGLLLLVVTLVIAAVPAFLRGTRALQITAVRSLLDVDLPDPPATAEPARAARETRLRSALWFATHLAVGGAVGLVLLIALPMALVFVSQQFGVGAGALAGLRIGPLDERDTGWLTVTGLVLLAAVGYAVAGLGALAAVMAPVLLGPSPTERIAALEARAARLAERNRLARDLHDSVGHALTVTTLQAAAAREVLDTDAAFVRRALAAIEETGRAAMADLDSVLGVLRADERADARDPDGRAPERTLADLDGLLADARATGVELDAEVAATVATVPAAVSREGFRIVQESLTNALRHGRRSRRRVRVTLRVAVTDGLLGIDVTNPAPTTVAAGSGGRGLAGMRERVALLGGSMVVDPQNGAWRVVVRLPADAGPAPPREAP